MKQKVHPAIVQALRPAKRRMRLYHAAQYAGTGILAACVSCAALAGVSYFVPIPRLPLFMALAALGLFSLSVLAGLLRPVSNELAARRADAGGLHERALTALALTVDTPMALLQREDAVRHLEALPLKAAIPLVCKRRSLLSSAVIALFTIAALILIPNPQNDVLKRREAFQKAMAEQAESVEEEAKKLEEAAYTKEELNALRKLMGDLARDLQKSTEPQQAYLAMDKAQRELEALHKNISDKVRADAAQAFEQSGLQSLSGALAGSDAHAAAAAVEQLSQSQETSAALEQASNAMPAGALKDAAAQAAQALEAGDTNRVSAALSALNSAMQSTCSGSAAGASASLGDLGALMAQLRSGTLCASQSGSGQAAGSGQGVGTGGNGQGGSGGYGQQQANAGGGAGKGSTNLDAGISKAGASSMGQGANPPGYNLSQYETIYDPTRLAGAEDIHKTTGVAGEGDSLQMQLGPGLGDASGQVPYHQVIFSYQDAASKAAQQELLPEGMWLWVDGYFQALPD